MTNNEKYEQAALVLQKYVLAASATGAIPVPAASAAIVAENSLMVNHIASIFGCEISAGTIVASIGPLTTANLIGRALFIEAARLLSWGAAFTGAPVLISAIGAGTAGLQTYLIGLITLEIAKRGGEKLPGTVAESILRKGKGDFDDFLRAAA